MRVRVTIEENGFLALVSGDTLAVRSDDGKILEIVLGDVGFIQMEAAIALAMRRRITEPTS